MGFGTNPLFLKFVLFEGDYDDLRVTFNELKGVEPVTLEDITDTAYILSGNAVVGSGFYRDVFANPADSGHIVAVTSFFIGPRDGAVRADMILRSIIGNLDGVNRTNRSRSVAPTLTAAASGVAGTYFRGPQGLPANSGSFSIRIPGGGAGDVFKHKFDRPLILRPNVGLAFSSDAADIPISYGFEMIELGL